MNLALPEIEQPVRLRFDRPMTDEELLRFCAENDPLRIERDANGEVIVMSPTGTEGGGTELDVGTELAIWARQDGRGKAYGPTAGVTLPDGSMRAADASWISWARINALSPERRKGFLPLCPEFVIEVRSDGDRLPPLQEKMREWLANGAELGWLIDPLRKTVEVYRPGSKHADVLEGVTAVYGEGPVGGFVLELARIWS
jgi:Uma2 family endonuclease